MRLRKKNNLHICANFCLLAFQVLHEPLIDEDPVFITTCTERELRKRKKRKFSLWVRQCTSTGFICQVAAHKLHSYTFKKKKNKQNKKNNQCNWVGQKKERGRCNVLHIFHHWVLKLRRTSGSDARLEQPSPRRDLLPMPPPTPARLHNTVALTGIGRLWEGRRACSTRPAALTDWRSLGENMAAARCCECVILNCCCQKHWFRPGEGPRHWSHSVSLSHWFHLWAQAITDLTAGLSFLTELD